MAQHVNFTPEQGRRLLAMLKQFERQQRDGRLSLEGTTSPAFPNGAFAVKVTIDGGGPGSSTTTCDYTYVCSSLSENRVFGTGMTPDQRRFPNIIYTATPDGSIGIGYRDENGDFALWSANELPSLVDCDTTPDGKDMVGGGGACP